MEDQICNNVKNSVGLRVNNDRKFRIQWGNPHQLTLRLQLILPLITCQPAINTDRNIYFKKELNLTCQSILGAYLCNRFQRKVCCSKAKRSEKGTENKITKTFKKVRKFEIDDYLCSR